MKRDWRFTKKITRGAIQPPTNCNTWASTAMVRSSDVVATSVASGVVELLSTIRGGIYHIAARQRIPQITTRWLGSA